MGLFDDPSLPQVPSGYNNHDLKQIIELLAKYEDTYENAGAAKWFVPGTPFSIERCEKHRAFFDAGATFYERLFMAGNRPLLGGTLVRTPDGYSVPIESLTVGSKVLAYDIALAGLVETTVTATYEYEEDAYLFGNKKGYEVGATPDHEFFFKSQRGVLSQLPAKDLVRPDRKVVVPNKWYVGEVAPGWEVSTSFLLGLLTGDGYLKARDDAFKFTNKCLELVELCAEAALKIGVSPWYKKVDGYYDVYFPKPEKGRGKSAMYDLLVSSGLYGSSSGDKQVPTQLFSSPEEHIRAYIHGLLATDGYARVGRYCLSTTSPKLAEGFVSLCLRLGVRATMAVRERKNPNHADEIVVSITGNSNLKKIGNVPTKPYILRSGEREKNEVEGVSFTYAKPLGKQKVYCITVAHPDHLFVANGLVTSNCGKSVSGAIEAAYHALGEYPSWWKGRRFTTHTNGWAAGDTARTTRDTVQRELLGPPGAIGTGTIPRDRILKVSPKNGVPGAVESVRVRHVDGGESTIDFLSYEQGVRAFYGTARHWIWLDEECPELIYNECLVRTMMLKDYGEPGSIFVTFTPLHGLTPFIINFMKNAKLLAGARPINGSDEGDFIDTDLYDFKTRIETAKAASGVNKAGRAVVQAGWNDAPWLDKEVIDRMVLNTPPHLLEARMHGYPSIGSGNVYPVPLEDIVCDPFEIPAHWKHIYALDVGWNRTACLWGAINPEDGMIYIYSEHYVGDARPELHAAAVKSRGEWMRGVIDPAARGRSQVDGQKLIDIYKKSGLRISPAKNEVESGIYATWTKLSNSRLKVFSTLHNFKREYIIYRRDLSGKVVKENDHLMDCLRYIILNQDVASQKPVRGRDTGDVYGGRKYDI